MKLKWNKEKDLLFMEDSIPIQSEKFLKEQERLIESIGIKDHPNFRNTDDLLEEFLITMADKFYELMDNNGSYIHDSINIKVEIRYEPENK